MTAHNPIACTPNYKLEPGQLDWSWAFYLFREIPGFPGYGIDTEGQAWTSWIHGHHVRTRRWKRLTPLRSGRRGYVAFHFRVNGKAVRREAQRLVLLAFIGPCPDGMEACHNIDPDPTNNRLRNLRWDTRLANAADRARHGTQLVGTRHRLAKLTEADIPVIRRLISQGVTQRKIGEQFGVHRVLISGINTGKRWAHVPRTEASLGNPE